MPDECINIIRIQGQMSVIQNVYEQAARKAETLNNPSVPLALLEAMVPKPPELIPNSIDWNLENWGTKWEAHESQIEYVINKDAQAELKGSFITAWTPPITAYTIFTQNNPGLWLYAALTWCGIG